MPAKAEREESQCCSHTREIPPEMPDWLREGRIPRAFACPVNKGRGMMDELEARIRELLRIIESDAKQDVVYLEDIQELKSLTLSLLGRDQHCSSCDGHSCD